MKYVLVETHDLHSCSICGNAISEDSDAYVRRVKERYRWKNYFVCLDCKDFIKKLNNEIEFLEDGYKEVDAK